MTSIIRFTLISLLFVQATLAQTINTQKLDDYLNTLVKADKFMGNILVVKNGEKLYSFSGGYENVNDKTPATVNTVYRIGSISKTITSATVLKAVEEGKLTLDQTIDKWFPTIPNASQITIRHLLNHHSGIRNFTADPAYLQYYTQPKTETEMVALIAKGGSDFTPGSKASYSNSNYVLLSYILEHIYGKSYEQVIREKISTALKLKTLKFGTDTDLQNSVAPSYSFLGNWVKEEVTHPTIPMGAGGIITNTGDLAQFANALFNGEIISKETLSEMLTLQDDFGLGIFTIPFFEKTGYGHTGRIDSYETFFCYFPEDKITYILFCNGENFKLNDINIAVLSAVYNRPFELPVFTTYTTEEDLKLYAGTYSSKEIPLVITISNSGNTLLAHPHGQPTFPMMATSKNTFAHDPTGVTLEFTQEKNEMVMKQNGHTFIFNRTDK